jgi:hypothetical protein
MRLLPCPWRDYSHSCDVDEDSFYKWQRRSSDTVAAALRDREAAAGGMVRRPADAPVTGLTPPVLRSGAT